MGVGGRPYTNEYFEVMSPSKLPMTPYFCAKGLLTSGGPFYKYGLTLISIWISNHVLGEVCGEITYSFPNFNGATVEFW